MIHSIYVRHNAEIAHRLSQLPGKCQQIHGHSLSIKLSVFGPLNENGILCGLDFGSVKKVFREHIDTVWDHHLHLNVEDLWVHATHPGLDGVERSLPGLVTHPGDPTTENIAFWIGQYMEHEIGMMTQKSFSVHVDVSETGTNGATWRSKT
jgi:6-pyruvoyltetrahydropterin/6-carboxytetrahydropterin synthase